MIKQLRNRFIRIATLSVTLVMVLLTIIVNAANYISTSSGLDTMLDIIAENEGTIPLHSAPLPEAPGGENAPDFSKPDGPLTPESPYSTRYFFIRYNGSGELIGSNFDHIAAVGAGDAETYLDFALEKGEGRGYYSGYKYLIVKHGDDRYMAVFLDCYQEMRAVKILALCSAGADAVCIALVYILVVLFSRRAIDPVVRSAEQQKQFITDAGHELKTPITVIATSLKVLEMETGPQKWIDKAMVQTEKLKDLVNSLVTLSRMDEEQSPLRFEDFDISESIAETAESFRDHALSRGHELHCDIQSELKYRGDEYAVRQLVSILLDNAVKYAAPGSVIDLSFKKSRRGVTLRTGNFCGSLPDGDLNKLFDRFYRPDSARNSADGGFGIGLSIARSIAQGHRGSIRAGKNSNYIEFTAELR